MTRKQLILFAASGSTALLIGALGFQYLGGLAPCKMCIWQRWPHLAAIIIGLIAILMPLRIWPYLGALAAATTGAIGVYHTGVERDWWEGPTSCSGGGLSGFSGSDLLSTDNIALPVMCDEVAWEFLSLSMASWNAIAAFGLMLVWLIAARRAD